MDADGCAFRSTEQAGAERSQTVYHCKMFASLPDKASVQLQLSVKISKLPRYTPQPAVHDTDRTGHARR